MQNLMFKLCFLITYLYVISLTSNCFCSIDFDLPEDDDEDLSNSESGTVFIVLYSFDSNSHKLSLHANI